MKNYGIVKEMYVGNTLKCDFIDLSTRFDYDGTKFYTPLARVLIAEEGGKL